MLEVIFFQRCVCMWMNGRYAGVMYRSGICFWSGQDVIFVSCNLFEICFRDVPHVSPCELTSAFNWNKRRAEEENLCLFFKNKDLCKGTHSILFGPFCLEGNLHALCLSKMSTVNTGFFLFFFCSFPVFFWVTSLLEQDAEMWPRLQVKISRRTRDSV